MARGDVAHYSDAGTFGSIGNIDKPSLYPARINEQDNFFSKPRFAPAPTEHRAGPSTQEKVKGRSERPQQKDLPSSVNDTAILREAIDRLDATARNGLPFTLITYDDHGKATTLQNFQQPQTQQYVEETMMQLKGFTIVDNAAKPHPRNSVEIKGDRGSHQQNISLQNSNSREDRLVSTEFVVKPRGSKLDSKKRQASTPLSRSDSPAEESEEEMPMVEEIETIQLRIDDTPSVDKFYDKTLWAVQQLALKSILKQWIKEVEPKRQKNFAYSHNNPPGWWPEGVIYKEPDHLLKEHRHPLAITIIRMMQDPGRNPDCQGITRLEKATNRISLEFDKEPVQKSETRKKLLKQLYDVARKEASYLAGEIDGSTTISVKDYQTAKAKSRKPKPRPRRAPKRQRELQSTAVKRTSKTKDRLSPLPSPVSIEDETQANTPIQVDLPTQNREYQDEDQGQVRMELIPQPHRWNPQVVAQTPQVTPTYFYQEQQQQAPDYSCSPALNVDVRCAGLQQEAIQFGNDTSPRYPAFGGAMGWVPTSEQPLRLANSNLTPIVTAAPMDQQDLATSSFGSTSTVPDPMQWTYMPHTAGVDIHTSAVPHGLPLSHPAIVPDRTPQLVYSAWTDNNNRRWDPTPAAY